MIVTRIVIAKFLMASCALIGASAAFAAVQVIGNSSARLCYQAAEASGKPSAEELQRCTTALGEAGLTPHDETATYVNRGVLKLRLGRLEEAAADFDRAIVSDPQEPEAYLNKGMALLRMNDGAQALPLFDTALAKRTRRPALAYYGRGVAQEMLGRIKAAYLDYRQASLIEPDWREPKIELSRFTIRR